MKKFQSTKVIALGSCAFRQPFAASHCKSLHGYRLQAKLWFGCEKLDENSWVIDFGSLKQLKEMLEKLFDHTTCIAKDDPELETFKMLNDKNIIDLRIFDNGVGIERFAETVYNIADKYIREKTLNRCWVDKVEVWEHEGNSAICEDTKYRAEPLIINAEMDGPNSAIDIFETLPTLVAATAVDDKAPDRVPQMSSDPTPSTSSCKPAPMSMPVTKGMSNPFAGTRWVTNTAR